ncbi:MAG: DUF192 domain-containing protein [Planctomycetota bacterium]
MRTGCRLLDPCSGVVLVPDLAVTETGWEATRGLLFRPPLGAGEGLVIRRCRAVHTALMRTAIDVVFLDAEGAVCKLNEALQPWRMAFATGGRDVLELPSGAARKAGLLPGRRTAVVSADTPGLANG